jgi:hypothetical protein
MRPDRSHAISALGLALAGTLLALPVAAEAISAKTAKSAPVVGSAETGKLDADAMAALDRMGSYLRSLKTFEVRSDNTREEVLNNGQKLQFASTTRYVASLPTSLFAELSNDRRNVQLYFNGKTLTVYTPATGYYAEAPAAGTVGQMLTVAATKYGIEFPLQDLFRWGDASATAPRPSEGFKVGSTKIGGVAVDHYAFRQPDVDFQIWIDQGDKPLPRRMVITSHTDPAQPQFTADFTWNTGATVAPAQFTFTPDAKAVKIPFATPAAASK